MAVRVVMGIIVGSMADAMIEACGSIFAINPRVKTVRLRADAVRAENPIMVNRAFSFRFLVA